MKLSDPVDPALWSHDDERELWRWKCYDSLWWFILIACGALAYIEQHPEDAGTLTDDVHRPYIDWLEKHHKEWFEWRRQGRKKRKNLLSLLPRFFRKTLLNTKFSDLWDHLHQPDQSTALGSEDTELAIKFQVSKVEVVSGEDEFGWFCWLYGNWRDSSRTNLKSEVVHGSRRNITRQEPSWYIFSMRAGLTGTHPDRMDVDDPLSYEKINDEQTWPRTVNSAISSSMYALRTDGMRNITMTRYLDNDPPGHFLPKEGIRSWSGMPMPKFFRNKCVVSPEGAWDVYFLRAEGPDRESVCPAIVTTEQLRERERENPIHYAAQYLNEPTVGEHMPIELWQAEECYATLETIGEEWLKHGTWALLCDTAFKDAKRIGTGDDSVCIEVCYHPSGNGDLVYVHGFGNNLYRTEDFTDEVVKRIQYHQLQRHRIIAITDEKTPGGKAGTWFAYLKSVCAGANIICPPTVELGRSGTTKQARLRMAAAFMVDGHVKLLRQSPGVEKLVDQMIGIGYTEHDDWADAFADSFHPDIYQPVSLRVQQAESPLPVSPGDEFITGMGDLMGRRRRRFYSEGEDTGVIDTIPDSALL